MKKIVILGATGSLGKQTIEVLKKYPKDFQVVGLSANKSEKLLKIQAENLKIKSQNVVIASKDGAKKLLNLSTLKEADIIINVLSGISGIAPTIAALKAKKIVILGNKESLIAEGKKIMALAKKTMLIPIDSEHNSIFEILKKYPNRKIKKIILPCSGGPFFGKTKTFLKNITVKEALSHPKWAMGAKISIESATLINKGLEVIEAHYLFDLPLNKIDVKIHPECQIHGIVEFEECEREAGMSLSSRRNNSQEICGANSPRTFRGDGRLSTPGPATFLYLSPPDMHEHIENALLYAIKKPSKSASRVKPLTSTLLKKYQLKNPDHKTFPGIKLVLKAFASSSKSPSKMKNFLKKEEKIIQKFLQNKIKFLEIYKLLSR